MAQQAASDDLTAIIAKDIELFDTVINRFAQNWGYKHCVAKFKINQNTLQCKPYCYGDPKSFKCDENDKCQAFEATSSTYRELIGLSLLQINQNIALYPILNNYINFVQHHTIWGDANAMQKICDSIADKYDASGYSWPKGWSNRYRSYPRNSDGWFSLGNHYFVCNGDSLCRNIFFLHKYMDKDESNQYNGTLAANPFNIEIAMTVQIAIQELVATEQATIDENTKFLAKLARLLLSEFERKTVSTIFASYTPNTKFLFINQSPNYHLNAIEQIFEYVGWTESRLGNLEINIRIACCIYLMNMTIICGIEPGPIRAVKFISKFTDAIIWSDQSHREKAWIFCHNMRRNATKLYKSSLFESAKSPEIKTRFKLYAAESCSSNKSDSLSIASLNNNNNNNNYNLVGNISLESLNINKNTSSQSVELGTSKRFKPVARPYHSINNNASSAEIRRPKVYKPDGRSPKAVNTHLNDDDHKELERYANYDNDGGKYGIGWFPNIE